LASIFPSNPTLGETFTSSGTSWQWNGEAWAVLNVDSEAFARIITSPPTENVVVDSKNDTLTFISGNNIAVTANSANDSITIAALPGVPSGGSAGQILAKISNDNYDADWIDGGSIGQSQDVEFTTLSDGDLFVYNSASGAWQNKNLFIHNNHDNVTAEYINGQILLSASPIPKANYGYDAPTYVGLEREVYYQLNEEEDQILDVYFYLNGDWRLYNDESFNWSSVNTESWQWLIDNSSVFGWEWLTTGAATPAGFDYKNQFVPNLIADIKYLSKSGASAIYMPLSGLFSGSSIVFNSNTSGSPSLNAGIFVERGNQNNVGIRWNEELDIWEFSTDGISYDELGSGGGALLFQDSQPDTSELEPGTVWIDSNEDVGSGFDIASFVRWQKTLSASATTISGLDDNDLFLLYTPEFENVYVNGTLLARGEDYIGSSGSAIVLTEAAVSGDIIEIHIFESFLIADAYTKTQSDAKYATQNDLDNIDLSPYLTISSASSTYEPNIAYVSASPSVPSAGTLWIDSSASATPSLKVYNGSTWIAVSGASDAGLHPFFTAGI
jgi:hypothetical protein